MDNNSFFGMLKNIFSRGVKQGFKQTAKNMYGQDCISRGWDGNGNPILWDIKSRNKNK